MNSLQNVKIPGKDTFNPNFLVKAMNSNNNDYLTTRLLNHLTRSVLLALNWNLRGKKWMIVPALLHIFGRFAVYDDASKVRFCNG